jgi:putative ABC transport system ATP-binding protein
MDAALQPVKQPLIDVRGLAKIYGQGEARVAALDGVDLSVSPGEFAAIVGPSGSGKSTLMNIIGCLDRPTAGAYVLDGRDVSRLSRNELAAVRSSKIGFIFQSFNLLPRLSALDNVLVPLLYHLGAPLSQKEMEQRAAAALEAVGLVDRMRHRPNQLSGGQQQRAAIARALVNRPALILADEPTGNLDSRSGREIMQLLHDLHDQGGTILVVTHSEEIASQAERIIHVSDGKITRDSPVSLDLEPALAAFAPAGH